MPSMRSRRIAVFFVGLALVIPSGFVGLVGLVVVASWADVETFCLLSETSHTADVYFVSFAAVIAATAIAMVGLMVAYVGRIRWRILVLPVAWLGTILIAEYLAALAISPQDCVGSIGGW